MAREELEIEGYLGQDPTKPSQNYPNLVSFSVGVSQSIKNKQTNEYESTTTWYKVSSWSESKAYLYQALKKGDKVVVKGRPSVEQWQGKDGQTKTTITINLKEIIMPPKKDNTNSDSHNNKNPNGYVSTTQPKSFTSASNADDSFSDDIPF
jgi:single-strand DNA-binding protein